MKAETAKLTIRLPKAHIEAAKDYARAHEITLTGHTSEAVQEISALLPEELDARAWAFRNRPGNQRRFE